MVVSPDWWMSVLEQKQPLIVIFTHRTLAEHPDLFSDYGFNNGVAAVAAIRTVESVEYVGEDGMTVDVRVGIGELIDLLYIGDNVF